MIKGGKIALGLGFGLGLDTRKGVNWAAYFKANSAFYSDGTIVGSQLIDNSSNGRHATISSNIITDGGAEYGSVLATWNAHAQIVVSNSTDQAHSGTKSFKCEITGASTVRGMRYQSFRTKAGEEVNYSFWVYRATNSALNIQVIKGDGSVGYQSLAATPTLNTWVQYSGKFTDAVGGGLGEIRAYVASGDMLFYFDDLSISITGQPTLGVTMSNDVVLKAIDSKNMFYTSGGIPITRRNDIGDPSLNNLQIAVGGINKYILMPSIPTAKEMKLLNKNFVDPNWVFDTCENTLTVGAGKTYATVSAAIAYLVGLGAIPSPINKYRIEVYDNEAASIFTDYLYGPAAYKARFPVVQFACIVGIGDITIDCTLPEDASNDNIGHAVALEILNFVGVKNIKFKKTNGRYTVHADASSMQNTMTKLVDCEFHLYDMDNIIAYRIANSLALPDASCGGRDAWGGGAQIGSKIQFYNCKFSAIVPFADHSDLVTGNAQGHVHFYKCDFVSMPYYNPTYNPDSKIKESIYLHGSVDQVKSICYIIDCTMNSTVYNSGTWDVSIL